MTFGDDESPLRADRAKGGSRRKQAADREFAALLRAGMRRKGWTQAQTARELSLCLPEGRTFNPVNLSHYLKGRSRPGPQYRKALSELLDFESLEAPVRSGTLARSLSLPNPRGGPHSEILRLEDLGGEVLLHINKRLPWPVALKILDVLTGQD